MLGLGALAAVAWGADRPTISGDPIIGQVLVSSPGPTGQALYKWQSCDPAVASCSDSLNHADPNWTDLTSESHTGQSYTVAPTDLDHFIRVLIHDNNLGDHWATSPPVGPVQAAPSGQVLGTQASTPPEHGVRVIGSPVAGNVRVKVPGQKGFQALSDTGAIPVKSLIDTRGSRVRLTAATGSFGDTTPDQSVEFYGGLFRITQAPAANSMAIAKLADKLACGKGRASKSSARKAGGAVAVSARRRGRRLWGSGHGSYATSGSGGTGSVRGTTWLTQDSCKGTRFRVTEGLGITVFDFGLHKQIDLGPGQSYFAKRR